MRTRFVVALLLAVSAGSHAARAAQPAARPVPVLIVDGDVTKPLSLLSADLKSLPLVKVEAKAAKGTSNVYEGVLVGELLKAAGVPLGQMRAGVVSSYAVASAADGYQAVFAVAELDPAFTSSDVIVADAVDGKPLSERDGPLRLVAPKDLMASRSVRSLRRIQVVRLAK
jgi:DMSO/TMAO reductase YedYZ molybdopterin-dependent catalytic subunit